MTVTERPLDELTAADRRDLLRWLARRWDATDVATREILLAAWAGPAVKRPDDPPSQPCTCGDCLGCLWDAYRWDLGLADGLDHEIWAELRSPGDIGEGLSYDQARDEIGQRVAGLEDLLLRETGAR